MVNSRPGQGGKRPVKHILEGLMAKTTIRKEFKDVLSAEFEKSKNVGGQESKEEGKHDKKKNATAPRKSVTKKRETHSEKSPQQKKGKNQKKKCQRKKAATEKERQLEILE